MRSLRSGILLALCAATAFGQEPRPQNVPVFSERVEVRVLDLDVDVTDSKGQSVPDLKREDFTVSVGGTPLPVEYFARVDQGAIHAPDLATASPDQMLATYRRGDEAFVPRNFLIFIDLGFLSPGVRNRSLEALRDMVARLGPDDATRVIVFDRSPRILSDWTTSKEATLSALASVERQGVGMSRLQAERQTLMQVDSTGRRNRQALVRQYAEEIGQEIETMLVSMRRELVTLTPLSGKKSFLFVTGGFEYQPGFVMSQYASGTSVTAGGPSLELSNVRDISGHLKQLVQRANADEITFYTVDARGLEGEGVGAGNDDPLQNRPRVAFQARTDRQAGLQEMALETGGLALLNTNDFVGGLSRVYQAVSTYYSLGVNLSSLASGKYESVRVSVNRPGVAVRTRRGFQARPEAEIVRDRALATMETDLAYTAIPARIETAPATPSQKLYNQPITVHLPASALTFIPQGEKAVAKAEFFVGATDDRGGTSAVSSQETTFELPADKAMSDTPLVFAAQLQTKKGNYRIVVNVRDVATGKMGTAKANVRVE